MKRVFAFCLVGSLPLLFWVCGPAQEGGQAGAQEQALPVTYTFESDYMSMLEIGQLLERMGREIQENGEVTFRGDTYPLRGYGGMEFHLRRRFDREGNERTGLEMGLGAGGSTDPPTRGEAYTHYETGAVATPTQVADFLDQMVANLPSDGTFAMDHHTGAFLGSGIVDQRLFEAVGIRSPGMGLPLTLETFVTFGEDGVQRHDDDEAYREDLEEGRILPLGTTEILGADQATVAEVFSSLASSLRSGTVSVGDGSAEVTDTVRYKIAHVAAADGSSEKIEFRIHFGPFPERPMYPREGPRYYEEPLDMPISELAVMLQRVAAEILEDGTFMLEGEEFTTGETVRGEILFSQRGITIEVQYNR